MGGGGDEYYGGGSNGDDFLGGVSYKERERKRKAGKRANPALRAEKTYVSAGGGPKGRLWKMETSHLRWKNSKRKKPQMETRPKKRVREKRPQWPQKRQAEAAVKEKEAGNEREREKREARAIVSKEAKDAALKIARP
jgi:pyocin large subunit-like protein